MYFFLGTTLCAQPFEILSPKKEIHPPHPQGKAVARLRLKNNLPEPIILMVRRTKSDIARGHSHYFCWESTCFDPGAVQLPHGVAIAPKAISSGFSSVLEYGYGTAASTATYAVYPLGHPEKALYHTFNFASGDKTGINSTVYASKTVNINGFYIGTASEGISVAYDILQPIQQVKITIHNILGNIVGEHPLPPHKHKLRFGTQHLNPGVYFYTLYVNNAGKMTRKFVVNR